MNESISKLVIVITIIAAIYLIYDDIRTERENNKNINDQIYLTFLNIEQNCLSFSEMNRPKKCELMLKMEERCSDTRRECPAEEYYETLQRLGFDLPPYYNPGFQKKFPIWKLWKN